jgi:dihydroxyacetone kinase
MAEEGATLTEILTTLDIAEENLGTLGICLIPGSRPGRPPIFNLGPMDFELAVGIHGETGLARVQVPQYISNSQSSVHLFDNLNLFV